MIKLFTNFTKREYLLIFISFVMIFIQVWLELKMPDYMAKITTLVQTNGSTINEIMLNGGYMLLCAFGGLICAIIVGYIVSLVASTFSLRTRRKLFTKVQDLSIAEVKQFSVDSLITRTTNDITQIEMLIGMGLQLIVKAPITAIWAITKIVDKSTEWSLMTGAAVAILLTVISILTIIVVPKFKIVQKLTDKINGVTRENLNGIKVVRAFNAEKYEENKFEEVNDKLTKQQMFNQKAFAIMSPLMYLVLYFLTLGIYFVGAYLIKDASMADKVTIFSNMIVFSSYAMQVIFSFLMLAMIFMLLPRAGVSAKRINEVLDTKITIEDGTVTSFNNLKGEIEFKNVSFKYPDALEYVIKNINFKVKSGEVVAFIGSTGSGKSTLINLVPRFYDATEGEILIDGINVKDYKIEYLNNKIGYVPQKAVMFDGTVRSNIMFGDSNNDKDDSLIEKAIQVSQANDFVLKLEKKYDSPISSGGTNISGGQKQRLAIARAIARNPEIYIFDDSFSALDFKTDAILRHELKEYAKNSTILIVASRIGTIMNADKIVVLDQGEMVGIGTHKQLLKKCSVYREIAQSQISKEELENE